MKTQVKKNWNEFFPNASPELDYTVTNQNTQYRVEVNAIYIISSTFVEVKNSRASGGAITFSVKSNDSKMLIEESAFFDCHTRSSSGGAVYMGSTGYFAINKCCSNFCFGLNFGSNGQFAFTVGDSSKIFETSIINSKTETNMQGSNTIDQRNSNITIKTVNISQNTCYQAPLGFLSSQNECLINLCSFENNTGSISGIYLSSVSPMSMMLSNLLRNSIAKIGLISSSGELTINGCTILDNTIQYTFQVSGSNTIVTNCTMSESDATNFSGNVNIDDWTPDSPFYNDISLQFYMNLCIATLKKQEDESEYFIGSFLIFVVLLQN